MYGGGCKVIKIKRFVYLTDHSDQRGLDLMRESGIIVEKLNQK